jgi:hypothetical protein
MTNPPTHTYANTTVLPNSAPLGSTANNTSGIGVNSVLTSTGTNANWITNTSIKTGTVNISDKDIVIDGLSLKATLLAVNQRLAVMIPNPQLEKEFEELRACADRYRELEQEFTEQLKMWNVLKSTDTK